MKINTWPIPYMVEDIEDSTAVVIDVLRASTTMTAALVNGAARIIPVRKVEEAFALRESMENVLLAGERDAIMVEGFDLGNSPYEYTPDVVGGKTIVMTTTNGTQAVAAAKDAADLIIAGFVNMSAVVEYLKAADRPVAILCAGTRGRYTLEDAACAGMIADLLGGEDLCDFTRACRDLYRAHKDELSSYLKEGVHAKNLIRKGFVRDMELAFQIDVLPAIARRNADGSLCMY
ncbi:MAG: 2-phosphosulfolactate phosphatase [Clostridia bacterium]|nr:2-phosphosulfolactate phosphatase [Clostridia bacterium]